MRFDNVVIAGYGETDYHKDDQDEPIEYIHGAVNQALSDAGVEIEDVDGFATTSYYMDHVNAVELGHHFGFSGRWFADDTFGNGSPSAHVVQAAEAIQRGKADTVVVSAGDAYTVQGNVDLMGKWHFLNNYMYPYGMGGANSHFGMIQRRHMHEYGTTREQLANVAVTQRENALAHDNGIFDDPLTKAEYMDSRPVAEPVHLYDCVHPCGGGNALVLTSKDKAAELDTPNVYIRAGEESHNPFPHDPFRLESPLTDCQHVFDEAGVTHNDVDAVEVYDNYAIWATIQLEDLGFCEKGEGGRLVGESDLSPEGDLPLNTGGGQLSMGQAGGAGGLLGTVEAVRQLRGEGGNRQVPDCDVAVAAGFGNVTYGGGLSMGVNIFSTEPGVKV
jgi:acetyl-CoA acetyltransferase